MKIKSILTNLSLGFAALLAALQLQAEEAKTDYMPKITMLLRTKAEQNLIDPVTGFYVRNARFGLKGDINQYIGYKVEIDWQDKEEIDMQDAKIIFKPFENFEFYLGQFKAPFAHDYQRNPADYMFINRNFITKRLCKNMRDVGAMASYKIPANIFPAKVEIGMFNGNGSNSTEHDKRKAGSAKLEIYPIKDGIFSASTYHGEVNLGDHDNKVFGNVKMYDLAYSQRIGRFFIEAEVAQKLIDDTTKTKYESFFTEASYDFPFESGIFKKISPAIRYEMYNKTPDKAKDSPRRISAGITFHLKENNNSYFRLDYEHYDYKSGVETHEDVISLEYVIRI
jgi:hypothetical protein